MGQGQAKGDKGDNDKQGVEWTEMIREAKQLNGAINFIHTIYV